MAVVPTGWDKHSIGATEFASVKCITEHTKKPVGQLLLCKDFQSPYSSLSVLFYRLISNGTKFSPLVSQTDSIQYTDRIVVVSLVKSFNCKSCCRRWQILKSSHPMCTLDVIFRITGKCHLCIRWQSEILTIACTHV